MAQWRCCRKYRLTRRKQKQLLVGIILVLLILVSFHIKPADKHTEEHPRHHTHSPLIKSNPQQNTAKNWNSWNFFKSLSNGLGTHDNQFTPVPSVDCQSKPQSDLPFCNPSLSPLKRAKDLVSRLTTSEKIAQTSSVAVAISRLGIKSYNWRSNCLHGWSKSGGHWTSDLKWTVFPAPIGLGATFNVDLIYKVGQVTADEGRALHNVMMTNNNGSSTEAAGLNCFSPNVNLFRDPRWGRGQETFGEDPYLISLIGDAYTHGLQEGEDSKYLKVAACAKHYVVHSGPEETRFSFTADVNLHDLHDTYLPAFKTQILASNVSQIMPAYNGVRCEHQKDGAPAAANPFLLKTILRERFGAHNISVVSDNGGIQFVHTAHSYIPNLRLAAAVCMNATTDLDLGPDSVYPDYLQSALDMKQVRMDTINDAVVRNFYLRMRVGDFDPPSMVPYQKIDQSHLDTTDNQALNLQAARESMVLLKNVMNNLPLHVDAIRQLAVVGPNANARQALLSNYEGVPSQVVSVLHGIVEAVSGSQTVVNYEPGCMNVKCKDRSKFPKAMEIVHSADYVVMVMGLDETIEGETKDRVHSSCEGEPLDPLALPGCQTQLVEDVMSLNSRVILVLINGAAVSIPRLYSSRAIIGIIEAFYPGALGGRAVADVLFGKYNPGGRMPVTVVDSVSELPPFEDYDVTSYPGRTYRYYNGVPLIPFGFGLSYTSFEYSTLVVSPSRAGVCESVKVSMTVQNIGEMAGDEVIQVYVQPPKISDKPFFPRLQLLAFERVHIKPLLVHMASFELNPYLLSLVDKDGERYVFPGEYTVVVGNQPDEEAQTEVFSIRGNSPVPIRICTSSPQCILC